MKIAITSIQRNRGPWIVEWLAFHLMVGFNQFYIYCHECEDDMVSILGKLAQHYPVVPHIITAKDVIRPQLMAYQHSMNNNLADVDWMAFIDGDEFLFPTNHPFMADALAQFEQAELSALGAYWVCYGSNGHLDEPGGLIMENYPRHSSYSDKSFIVNRHFKSIVRGRQSNIFATASHLFTTQHGTCDDKLNLLTKSYDEHVVPTYDAFRINHYVTQSYDYCTRIKQSLPLADMESNDVRRPTEWFHWHDRNECDDGISYNFLVKLKLKVRELQECLVRA